MTVSQNISLQLFSFLKKSMISNAWDIYLFLYMTLYRDNVIIISPFMSSVKGEWAHSTGVFFNDSGTYVISHKRLERRIGIMAMART